MTEQNSAKIHWSFWLISGLAFVWNAMGILNFFVQMVPEIVKTFPESHQAIINGRPVWATLGFAIAVFGGTIGCFFAASQKIGCLLFVYRIVNWCIDYNESCHRYC